MEIELEFEEFIGLLNKYKVEYLVIGGYALAFHGRPRNTGDIDIWINVSEINAEKIVRVISEFGFSSLGLTKDDFMTPGYITQLGYPPKRIDILTNVDGIEFKEAIKNMEVIRIDGLLIQYIGLNDFIANKESAGRKKDIADIKEIKKIAKSQNKAPKKTRSKGNRP